MHPHRGFFMPISGGLAPDTSRVQVQGFGRSTPAKAVWAARRGRTAYAERKGSTNTKTSVKIEAQDGTTKNFPSDTLLRIHYEKHVNEFGTVSEQEYLALANNFARKPLSYDVVQIVRSDNSVSKYCFSTNGFLVVNQDGTIRTYFKPVDKEKYWQDELDRN